jgi:hypothetical protein
MSGLRRAVHIWLIIVSACIAKAQQPAAHNVAKYLGPGSCAAAACHGNIAPQKTTSVNQNEYSIWVVQDRHASAFRVLQNPVSQRMGRLLGIGKPEQSPKCLVCHALYVPAPEKGRNFDLNDGVSCESCHGPSSMWLGSHTTKGWTREKSVALGMVNNWDPVKRAEQCLTCHLGTSKQVVDHEMIAAGHPDLVFDLESYSAAMPPHWKVEAGAKPVLGTWAIGQAVQLREALDRLSRRANEGTWPEYSEYECYACHHNLVAAEKSWRQKVGYPDRRPGNPPWNAAHFAVLRVIAKQMQPDTELEKALAEVFRTTSDVTADREKIAQAAKQTSSATDRLVASLHSRNFDQADAKRLLSSLTAESERLANMGPKTAEQATLALQSIAAIDPARSNKEFDAELKALYRELESPSSYNPAEFADHFRRAASKLR